MRVALALAALLVVRPTTTQAQAWVPVQRETNVSLIFQRINLDGHFDTDGSRLEGCIPSRAYEAIVELDYGLTDKLAIGARLPYIASTFTGSDEEPCSADLRQLLDEARQLAPGFERLTSLDTGSYYATFQDVGVTLRYNLFEKGIVVTPLVGVTIPSHHYRTIGEAAPGQDRLAVQAGVNVGRLLDPLLPRAYVHGRYTYSFVQSLFGIPLDRSNAEVEVGYGVAPTVVVRALGAYEQTHGGLSYADALERGFGNAGSPPRPELFLEHDRLLASRYWHVGGGATISVTDSVDLETAVLTFVSGADSHYGVGVTVGMTWRRLPSVAPARK